MARDERDAIDVGRREVLKGAAGAAGALAVGALVGCGRATPTPPSGQGSQAMTTSQSDPVPRAAALRMPAIYIPHGGGPCFFMEWRTGPPDTWDRMGAWLRALPETLPAPPKALLVVSAHWEEAAFTVTSGEANTLYYDYYGFPEHTYRIAWPAPAAPGLATRVQGLIADAGLPAGADAKRGLDHGVFIPLKLGWPEAQVPTVQLSLRRGLDPAEHVALGRALAPLRDEGVLIVASGMSFHNMAGFRGGGAFTTPSEAFDAWLAEAVALPWSEREARLAAWASAPAARTCHPREEHLIPLMVAAGAGGDDVGTVPYRDHVLGLAVSAHRFG